MLVSENDEICVSPDAKHKIAFPPTQNPKSQWNIGYIGSLALGLCVGHVHFIFFVLISFALGSRRKRSFQWNMGFSISMGLLQYMIYSQTWASDIFWSQPNYVRCQIMSDIEASFNLVFI